MSGLIVPSGNWDREARRLKQAGYALPNNPVMARLEAKRTADTVAAGNIGDLLNRKAAADMNRRRAASTRGAMIRTGSDLQMALPKVRQPLSSLMDKGIPFNINDPKELIELRRWSRLFYSTHDLVPLLIDIYSKFPVQGVRFTCFSGETPVITLQGVRPIRDLSGSSQIILTEQGRWVEAPFKEFGEQKLHRVTVSRNGRSREFYATAEHRWFVEQKINSRRGATSTKREVITTDLCEGMALTSTYGKNVIRNTNPSPFGIAHGFVVGDGTRASRLSGGCRVTLFGEKDANLLPYFQGCTQAQYHDPGRSVQGVMIRDLPLYFKELPSIHESVSYLYGWLAGYFAADGTVSKAGEVFLDSADRNRVDFARAVCQRLGIHTSDIYVIPPRRNALPNDSYYERGESYRLKMANASLTESFFCIPEHRERWAVHAERIPLETWRVVSVEETDRVETVYCAVVPETASFVLDGNILTGNCKDPLIEKFYESMFMDDLDYEEFLPDSLLREYFIAGEVTALAHFDEQLGIWSSEEILNPDMIMVNKSMFVKQERTQLLVKDLVESLRDGPEGQAGRDERPSERMERMEEYAQIAQHYPEMLEAATRDDGIDMSEALISRLVNRANPWDNRGTPFLLRSFRTLLMEESLNAAQDAVADRLYSPMILATMGIQDMGDGEPWIPSQQELDDLRNDMQTALAADFKLMVHNFGVNMESILGRESVPNFDSDYDRVDAKLMQAWGIGQALIMGGNSAGGAYASSALNREVCEQLMKGVQNKVKKHMRKRMEIIAEVQEHYDYELKGGRRIPLYREIVEEDPDTGEQRIVRVPKLLIPEVTFDTLNLRDESTERAFLMELKQMGVPIADRQLALNIEVDFEQNLEREAQESVDKGIAKAQAFKKMQDICDAEGLPYPPELATHLEATLQLREMLSQTKMAETQQKMMDQQAAMASPAGQMGALPGQPGAATEGVPMDQAMATAGMGGDPGMAETGQDQEAGDVMPPGVGSPSTDEFLNSPDYDPVGQADNMLTQGPARGFSSRPAESDEMRAGAPRAAKKIPIIASRDPNYRPVDDPQTAAAKWAKRVHSGPSRLGQRKSQQDVENAVRRHEAAARDKAPRVSDLVRDPDFYRALNMGAYRNQIQSDYADIRSGRDSESAQILREMIDQYEDATGITPRWD